MQKQKKGFWLFIFSLIPGAGEMYMGFKKQGLSTMLLFWAIFAFGAGTGMDWLILFFPIVWFYSFFNVHNLKSLSEEEFYSIEDSYILHLDALVGDANTLLTKYRTAIAVLLIVFGGSILWNGLIDSLCWILPSRIESFLRGLSYRLPQLVIAVAIILCGIYILTDKKHQLNSKQDDVSEKEHFWQPYRPYQQPEKPDSNTRTNTEDIIDADSRIVNSDAQTETTTEETITKTTIETIPATNQETADNIE